MHTTQRHDEQDMIGFAHRPIILGVALLPIQFSSPGLPFRIAPADLCFAAAVLLLGFRNVGPPPRLMFLWFSLVSAITLAVAIGYGRGTLHVGSLVDRWAGAFYLLLPAFAVSSLRVPDARSALRSMSWVALLASVLSAAVPSIATRAVASRNSGFLIDPNYAGVFLTIALVIEIAYLVHELDSGKGVRLPSTILVVGLGWALIQTGSRTGWASLAAGLLALALTYRQRLLAILSRHLAAIAVVIGGAAYLLRHDVAEQLRNLSSRPDNVARRSEVLEESVRSFTDNPLTGAGLLHTLQAGIGFPHSSLLWLAGDAGIIGVLAYGALAGAPVFWARKRSHDHDNTPFFRVLVCALVGMIVASFGIEAIFQRQWWVLIGCVLCRSVRADPLPGYRNRTPVFAAR